MNNLSLAFKSTWRFIKLIAHDKHHRRKDRLGRVYHIPEHGDYRIFRETVSSDGTGDKPVLLIVGFRLKVLGQSIFLHKIFQKLCILTTPIWSGFTGFKVKLWMVQPTTSNYMGIYDWAGKDNATFYVKWLTSILNPLCIPKTIWYEIKEVNFEKYLEEREYKLP